MAGNIRFKGPVSNRAKRKRRVAERDKRDKREIRRLRSREEHATYFMP